MIRFVKGQIICQLTNNLSFCQFPRPVMNPGCFGPIPVRSDRFGPIFGVNRFGLVYLYW